MKPESRCAASSSIAERLERLSIPEPTTGCTLWFGSVGESGHGRMNVAGKYIGPHRVAWELAHGPVPAGKFVCHRCDMPACVNPDHLWLGSHDENMADMVAKGRKVVVGRKGEASPQAKLTDAQVLEIFADRRAGDVVAKDYPVSRQTVDRIRNGSLWSHLTSAPQITTA